MMFSTNQAIRDAIAAVHAAITRGLRRHPAAARLDSAASLC
jgi:hypothetical protein